jgi:hypothetical protein
MKIVATTIERLWNDIIRCLVEVICMKQRGDILLMYTALNKALKYLSQITSKACDNQETILKADVTREPSPNVTYDLPFKSKVSVYV